MKPSVQHPVLKAKTLLCLVYHLYVLTRIVSGMLLLFILLTFDFYFLKIPPPGVMAKFIYSSRVSNWAELFSVWKYLCAYSPASVSWSCLPGLPWHSLTYDVRRLTGRGLTQGFGKERAGLFSPARPLRQGWTGLRKGLGFNLSRKVFSK